MENCGRGNPGEGLGPQERQGTIDGEGRGHGEGHHPRKLLAPQLACACPPITEGRVSGTAPPPSGKQRSCTMGPHPHLQEAGTDPTQEKLHALAALQALSLPRESTVLHHIPLGLLSCPAESRALLCRAVGLALTQEKPCAALQHMRHAPGPPPLGKALSCTA